MNPILEILNNAKTGTSLTISAWVRTVRSSGKIAFIELNDGSSYQSLQVVCDAALLSDGVSTGCSIRAKGELVESPATGQRVELRANSIELLGVSPSSYPLQKKRHSFEFLRSIPHLRARTNSLAAVCRVRHSLALAVHQYFSKHHFYCIHSPIITTIDAEGGGAVFKVDTQTTARNEKEAEEPNSPEHFFGIPAYLTVSGQLHAECYAHGISRVYSFGPTFRAENSNTSRHLSEFWMLEPEACFLNLDDIAALADDTFRTVIASVLDSNESDIEFFDKWIEKGLRKRLETVVSTKPRHISYDEAIKILQASKHDFSYPVAWGNDLQTEHERYICEIWYKGPVIVYNYPRSIKPFYMRKNDDEKTVAAMDMLVPVFGEIIGGSQREERLDVLVAAMQEKNIDMEHYRWYIDLRRYGSVMHSGFGLGFDRLVQYVTGMQNIRDAIPFPRSPGNALC